MSVAPGPLIDTHCHIMDEQFAHDLPQVLERAWSAGLRALVCVGYDLESSNKAVNLARAHEGIFATVGIHPNYAAQAGPDDRRRIEDLAGSPKVVGVGETGLDYFRDFTEPSLQEEFLSFHLELAARRRLPLIIHNRQASERLSTVLLGRRQANAAPGGVLHCFSGDSPMLHSFLDAGWFISFAGPVTFKNSGLLPSLAREVPWSRLVVETDAPYLAPAPVRGRRNEPAFLVHTVRFLAGLREETAGVVAERTYQNARVLFPEITFASS